MHEINPIENTTPLDKTVKKVWLKPVHTINIVGIMGTGKTTLARYLYSLYRWGRTSRGKVVSVYFQYDKRKIDDLIETIKNVDADYCYVVLDDLSFMTMYLDKNTRKLMHVVAKIRHYNSRVKRWAVVTIQHYSKAALPFLRLSGTKILTSLTSTEEIETLREAFPVQVLWDYYYLYTNNPNGHWILVNWLGNIFISRFRRPRKRCWDIVVSGPECV